LTGRFIFRLQAGDEPFDHALPKLAMTIDLESRVDPPRQHQSIFRRLSHPREHNSIFPFDKCDIYIHEPLAARTAFAILKTPVVQYDKEAGMAFYPVTALASVHLDPGAYLHCHAPTKLASMRFDLALRHTLLEAPQSNQIDRERMCQTAWELLKLWKYCIRPEYAEPTDLEKISDDIVAQRYVSARKRAYLDLEFRMDRSTLMHFLAEVSREKYATRACARIDNISCRM
jgi:hypothetical protein